MASDRAVFLQCFRAVFIVSIILASAACATSPNDRIEIDRFKRAWTDRHDGYAAQWNLANAELRRQGDVAGLLMTNRGAKSWPAVAEATARLIGAANHVFEIAGRRALLGQFIDRMDSEPSVSAMRRWLQAEAERIGEQHEDVQAHSMRFLAELRDDPVAPGNLFREAEELAAEQGLVRGQADELQAAYRSATAYFASLEDGDVEDLYEDEDDRRVATQALAGNIALSQAVMQRRIGEELARPRMCRESGDIVVCSLSHGLTQTDVHGHYGESQRRVARRI